MKVLIYNNKEKDVNNACRDALIKELASFNVKYKIIENSDLNTPEVADALFAIGGDGTILFLVEYSNKNNIPIIGINAGKLGFLCEFEKSEIRDSVEFLLNGKFIKDNRQMLKVVYKNNEYYALNDVYVQRTYDILIGNMVAGIKVKIDDISVAKFKGDGVIVSSPTGSTAYSFSLGAPILAPKVPACVMTPIAAHTFNQRPVVYSSDSTCKIFVTGKAQVGVFVDGKHVAQMNENDCIEISSVPTPLVFLRKNDYNFFMKLSEKMNTTFDGDNNG